LVWERGYDFFLGFYNQNKVHLCIFKYKDISKLSKAIKVFVCPSLVKTIKGTV